MKLEISLRIALYTLISILLIFCSWYLFKLFNGLTPFDGSFMRNNNSFYYFIFVIIVIVFGFAAMIVNTVGLIKSILKYKNKKKTGINF